MTSIKPKHRIIEKAKTHALTPDNNLPKKLAALLTGIAADEDYWLWMNESLFDNFNWASEAMACRLNKLEVLALRKYIVENDLEDVSFDDTRAYKAIIETSLRSELSNLKSKLLTIEKNFEESTATVLKVDLNSAVATGFIHGIPLTAYFEKGEKVFIVYVEKVGRNNAFETAAAIPLNDGHFIVKVARAVEEKEPEIEKACRLKQIITMEESRLDNLEKIGITTLDF